ncbi:hypothetical protein OPS25_05165 [Alteromonas ponticola]|uniref:Uncharacterized protein n=1 Tax=Alteromonas aquimaris TaxID=2998417 RepID=A0ABT3P547_9ALTE|nr:hypothetical protein [Alteromonas aquimaris]MCW8107887.1 hypothetical protein [Alteromonas aquimaris]
MRPKRQQQVVIDRQILALHKAMVDKVVARPELCEILQNNLERYKEMGLLSYGSALLWESILAAYSNPTIFRELILSNEQRMAQLRRRTIFSGILTENEREKVLAHYITSELS